MTILYLDIGNSRIKWMTDDAAMQAVAHQGAVAETIASVVADCAPARVVAVDVIATLPQGLPDGLTVDLFSATENREGLSNGYAQPSQLGADRWAAIVGAWQAGEPVLERRRDDPGEILWQDAQQVVAKPPRDLGHVFA